MYFPKDMNFQYFFFDTYIGYFFQVLPIAIVVGLIYWLIKYRNDKITKNSKKIFSTLFVVYITGLICLLLGIDLISNLWYRVLYHAESGNSIRFFEFDFNFIPSLRVMDFEKIGNLLIYIPFGILYPLSKGETSFRKTVLLGFIFVLFTELLQPFFARAFDINDVILNTIGIVISSGVYFAICKQISYLATKKSN